MIFFAGMPGGPSLGDAIDHAMAMMAGLMCTTALLLSTATAWFLIIWGPRLTQNDQVKETQNRPPSGV